MDEVQKKLLDILLSRASSVDESLKNFSCPNKECKRYGVSGRGNICVRAKSGKHDTRLLRCRKCGQTFSERIGTILENSRLDPQIIVDILKYLGEGKSQRAISRLLVVDRSAVARYAKLAGGQPQKVHDELVAFLSEKRKDMVRREVGLHPKTTVVNTGECQACISHPILEMIHPLDSVSVTARHVYVGNDRYEISSVDGNSYPITFFTSKLWDLILLRLTELVYSDGQLEWGDCEKWHVRLNVKTIADSLGCTDLFPVLHDHIAAAEEALRNICITVNKCRIEGYLVSEPNDDVLQTNTDFSFRINPALIQYIKDHNPGLYHFDLYWLRLPVHRQKKLGRNVYSAVKFLSRCCGQNAQGQKNGVVIIADLIKLLPYLKKKRGCTNRKALDNALKAVPGIRYFYVLGKKKYTFEELTELGLRAGRYNRVKVAVEYDEQTSLHLSPCHFKQ